MKKVIALALLALFLVGCVPQKEEVQSTAFNIDGKTIVRVAVPKGTFHISPQAKDSFNLKEHSKDVAFGLFVPKDLGDSYQDLVELEYGPDALYFDDAIIWGGSGPEGSTSYALIPIHKTNYYLKIDSTTNTKTLQNMLESLKVTG